MISGFNHVDLGTIVVPDVLNNQTVIPISGGPYDAVQQSFFNNKPLVVSVVFKQTEINTKCTLVMNNCGVVGIDHAIFITRVVIGVSIYDIMVTTDDEEKIVGLVIWP